MRSEPFQASTLGHQYNDHSVEAPRRLVTLVPDLSTETSCSILITLADPVLAAVQCPLDQMVSKDAERGREFITQRVGGG